MPALYSSGYMQQARRYAWVSTGVFVVTVLVCVLLKPNNVWGHAGLSLYGNLPLTVAPYALGLLVSDYFLLRVCQHLERQDVTGGLRTGLIMIVIAVVGIVVTPSLSGAWLVQDLHVLFGLAVFLIQLVLSWQYLLQTQHNVVSWLLFGLQVIAIGLVLLSFRPVAVLQLMLPGQILAVIAFAALVIRAVDTKDKGHASTLSARNM